MSDDAPNNGNLINFIAATLESMRDQMATKDQLEGLATKDQLEGLANKSDIARLEAQITAVRGDIEQVHLRLDSIDQMLRARLNELEVEIMRGEEVHS
jgi:outer membrane protein TolC